MARAKKNSKPISQTPAWRALESHARSMRTTHVRALFARDRKRFSQLSCEAAGLLLDFSRQRLTGKTASLLFALAQEARLGERIAALLAGQPVNNTENRPALHTALRRALDQPLTVNGRNVMQDVRAEREKLSAFVRSVH